MVWTPSHSEVVGNKKPEALVKMGEFYYKSRLPRMAIISKTKSRRGVLVGL